MDKLNLKIALTGSIGSGKSSVADLFREHGARIVNADEVSRCLLEPSEKGWTALEAEFGDRFLNADLTIDRKKLRKAIFNDESLRIQLNSILHPLIKQTINEICDGKMPLNYDSTDDVEQSTITIVEVPLLFEVGWQEDFDLTVVVRAEDEICLGRVMRRDGVDRLSAMAAFATQMSVAEKVRMADYVIDNNGTIEETALQVNELYGKLSS